ncbi:divergent protein kinase domain 1A-like isoform X2 [Tubulanus polymorphus]
MLKSRHLPGIALVAFLIWFVFVMFRPDPCKSDQFRVNLCELYESNIITGTLCPHVCKSKTWKFHHCHVDKTGQISFIEKPSILKLGHQAEQLWHGHSASGLYMTPEEGMNVRAFKKLLKDFLDTRLGSSDHEQIFRRILNVADVNADGKISLSEAKTIWSLIQNNEFLLLLVFQGSHYVSELRGFCGDFYAVEYVLQNSLPVLPPTGINRYWSSLYDIAWHKKVKICIGLLEFTLEAYQHGADGSFYMCDLGEHTIGYTKNYEARVTNLALTFPRKTLHRYVKRHFCNADADCVYTRQCQTTCDRATRRCSADLVRPNLVYVCQIIERYMFPDVPRGVRGELKVLLDRCKSLNIYARDMQLQHSLLLNELKSLLWKQISSDV